MNIKIEMEHGQADEALRDFDAVISELRGKTKTNVLLAANGILVIAERVRAADNKQHKP